MKKIILISTLVTTLGAYSYDYVFDPIVASIIVQTHNIMYELQLLKAEIANRTLNEQIKTNQQLYNILENQQEQLRRQGNVATTQDIVPIRMPSTLELKMLDQVKEEARIQANLDTESKLDKETLSNINMLEIAIKTIAEQQQQNYDKRRQLTTMLDQTTEALANAKTDAEVQKLQAEINAIQTSLIALDQEMREQERTFQIAQFQQDIEEIKKTYEEEAKLTQKHQKNIEENQKVLQEKYKEFQKNPTDKNNIFYYLTCGGDEAGELLRKVAEADSKGDFFLKSLKNGGNQSITKEKIIRLSVLGIDEDTPEKEVQYEIQRWTKLGYIVIDDRKKDK